MRTPPQTKARLVHPLAWVIEPLEKDPTLVVRAMFGCRAVYLHGRLVLCLAAKREPWLGVLVPTDRTHHAALIAERPALRPHPVLAKWLYLPEGSASFERDAAWLVARARAGDPRVGVAPGESRRPGRKRSGSGRMGL